jgi:hypothetical protein
VQDTNVVSFAVGSLGGVDYVVDLNGDGWLKASNGTRWQDVDRAVLDYAFTIVDGTDYLSGHDAQGSFQFSSL